MSILATAILSSIVLPVSVNAISVRSSDHNIFTTTILNIEATTQTGNQTTTDCGQSSVVNCSDPAVNCNSNTTNCDLVQEFGVPAINLFSGAFGLIAVISLIMGGINYTTSEGDPKKISRAKIRIRNTIFAVVFYLFLYAFLNFLVPGGIFK